MTFKSKEFVMSVVIISLVFLGQLWLTDFKIFKALNIKLCGVMIFNIFTLSFVSSRNKNLKLPLVVAYQTILVSSMSILMLVSYHTLSGNFNYTETVLSPIFIGIGIYVFFYSAYSVFDVKNERRASMISAEEIFSEMGLTPREKALAALILKGYSNKDIAKELFIAETTVKKHVQNIFKKVGVSSKVEFSQNVDDQLI